MRLPPHEILRRLGSGGPIAGVCEAAGLAREQFKAWWQEEIRSRVPDTGGTRRAAVGQPVRIDRDCWGIPHVYADNDEDLCFGFGYTLAQALQAVDSQSQSGYPGSPHYGDQFPTWLRGEYHTLPLDRAEASRLAVSTLALEPL